MLGCDNTVTFCRTSAVKYPFGDGVSEMNAAEKIAATYLRLNGFLLLPHFTVFEGGYHGHVDLVGLRAAGSKEGGGELTFPTDDGFFAAIPRHVCERPRDTFLGLVAEVRTNKKRDEPEAYQVDYVRNFLGGVPVLQVTFFESDKQPSWPGGCLEIGNEYALRWIIERVRWMDKNHTGLTKSGSWPWSDDALAEFLVLYRYGAFGLSERGDAADRPRE